MSDYVESSWKQRILFLDRNLSKQSCKWEERKLNKQFNTADLNGKKLAHKY